MPLKKVVVIPKKQDKESQVFISVGKFRDFLTREEAESLYRNLKVQLGYDGEN